MRYTGWSWRELVETPASVVVEVMDEMLGESDANATRQRWQER